MKIGTNTHYDSLGIIQKTISDRKEESVKRTTSKKKLNKMKLQSEIWLARHFIYFIIININSFFLDIPPSKTGRCSKLVAKIISNGLISFFIVHYIFYYYYYDCRNFYQYFYEFSRTFAFNDMEIIK